MNIYHTKAAKIICLIVLTLQVYCHLCGSENSDMTTLNEYVEKALRINEDMNLDLDNNPKFIKDNDYCNVKNINKAFIVKNWNALTNLNKNKDLTKLILLKILYLDVDYNKYIQIFDKAMREYDNKKINLNQFIDIYTHGEMFLVFNYHSLPTKRIIPIITKIFADGGDPKRAKYCQDILTGLPVFNRFRYIVHQPSAHNLKKLKKDTIYSGLDLKYLLCLAAQALGYEAFTGFNEYEPESLKKIKLQNITKETSFNEIEILLSNEPFERLGFNGKINLIEQCFRLTNFTLPFLSKTLHEGEYSIAKKKMIIDIIIKNLFASEQADLLLSLIEEKDIGLSAYTENKLAEKFFGAANTIDKKQVIERLMSKEYINLTQRKNLKLYVSSENFNTSFGKYESGQDIFLNIIIYNEGKEQQKILLPEQRLHLFGFFFMISIEGSGSMSSSGGKVSLLPESYRYIILNPKEMFGIKINLLDVLPELKTGKYKVKIQYNNQYGTNCFKGILPAEEIISIEILSP